MSIKFLHESTFFSLLDSSGLFLSPLNNLFMKPVSELDFFIVLSSPFCNRKNGCFSISGMVSRAS
jgi:hypothetical protein